MTDVKWREIHPSLYQTEIDGWALTLRVDGPESRCWMMLCVHGGGGCFEMDGENDDPRAACVEAFRRVQAGFREGAELDNGLPAPCPKCGEEIDVDIPMTGYVVTCARCGYIGEEEHSTLMGALREHRDTVVRMKGGEE